MSSERRYELARYIRIPKPPEDMTIPELIDTLEDVAEYASRRVSECHTLRNVLNNAIKKEA